MNRGCNLINTTWQLITLKRGKASAFLLVSGQKFRLAAVLSGLRNSPLLPMPAPGDARDDSHSSGDQSTRSQRVRGQLYTWQTHMISVSSTKRVFGMVWFWGVFKAISSKLVGVFLRESFAYAYSELYLCTYA